MKTIRSFFLSSLAILAVTTVFPVVRAAEPDQPPPPSAEGGGRGPRGDRLKMLVEQLGLTDDQKAKIKPIVQDEMAQMKAIRDDTTLDQDQRRAKFMEIMKKINDQIRPILTPEQQEKLDKMKEARGGGKKKPSA